MRLTALRSAAGSLCGLRTAADRYLASQQRLGDRGQRARQLGRRRRLELRQGRVAGVGARQQLGLVEQPVLPDQRDERRLVALAVVGVLDLEVVAGQAAQAHDLAHRGDALRACVDALEAVRAVIDAVRVLGEVLQALEMLVVARIAHEAIGLGERCGPDELRVDLHRQAVRDAGAALDAGHRLRHVDHRLARHDVLALGDRLLRDEPRGDAPDLLPVDRLHVHDEVLDDGHVAHRLDLDHAVGRMLLRLVEVRVTGEVRMAVDAHAAGAADRRAARAADPDRPVVARLGLQDALEHRAVRLELDRVLLPVRAVPGLGVVAAQSQGELGHQCSPGGRSTSTSSLQVPTS